MIADGADYIKRCSDHVSNIAKSVKKINDVNVGSKEAKSREAEDEKKLEEAGKEERLTKEQQEKAEEIVKRHQALGGMSGTIAKTMQKFGIASEAINFAVETANLAGAQIGYATRFISAGIEEGLELAMFAMRLFTDKQAVQDYLFSTDEGLKTVNRVAKGYQQRPNAFTQKKLKMISNTKKDYELKASVKTSIKSGVVDDLADAQGYEHTSEMIEDLGMQMAQSIVFCASRYNNMMSTKIMAITVMGVMGMAANEIGQTSPAIVEKLFNAFKMAR